MVPLEPIALSAAAIASLVTLPRLLLVGVQKGGTTAISKGITKSNRACFQTRVYWNPLNADKQDVYDVEKRNQQEMTAEQQYMNTLNDGTRHASKEGETGYSFCFLSSSLQ
jgi:hypothetical protein